MQQESPESETTQSGSVERAGTPFDRPYFMPVLLFVLALWFGYDGWFNDEIESIMFNSVVFVIMMVLMVYTTWQDVRYTRKSKD